MNKNINNVLRYSSYFLVFVLPIFYINKSLFPYIAPKTFLFYGVVEILTAFWIYLLFTDKSYRLSKTTLLYFVPLFCFIIWMSVAGILANNPMLSFWSTLGRGTGLLTLYHALSFALIVSSLVKKNGNDYLYGLIRYLINGGFVLAISVWFGSEGFDVVSFLRKSGGLMGNSSITAGYLFFILTLGVFFLFSKSQEIKNKWWWWTKIGAILFLPLFVNFFGLFRGDGLFGTARGATIGILVAILVTGVWYLIISQKKNLRILGASLMCAGLVIFLVGWMQLVNPNTKLHKGFIEAASGTRFVFQDIAQKSMDKHPYFGYGPENYPIAFQEFLNPKMALPDYGYEVWTDRVHNIYYDVGVSGGYPAIAFYFLFIVSIFYVLYIMRNSERFSKLQISIIAGILIGYIFQNLFVFDSTLSIMILFITAGIIFSEEKEINKEKKILNTSDAGLNNLTAFVLIILCIASLTLFVFRPVNKIYRYSKIFNMPIDLRAKHYDELLGGSSIGEQWDVGGIANDTYKLYNESIVSKKADKNFLPYAIDDISNLLKYLEKIYEKNKNDARLNITIISLYNTLNFLADNPYDPVLFSHLEELFDNMKIISPQNPVTYWIMAQSYIWKGDFEEVKNIYQQGISLDPSIPESYMLLLRFTKAIGDQKLYNDTLLKAKENIPDYVFKD